MTFSSLVFIFCFFPVFFAVYFTVPKNYKNLCILAGSILFYAWGAPRFVFVILGTTALDFYIVRAMAASMRLLTRRILFGFSLAINLSLLFYFKYFNFFADSVNILLHKLHFTTLPLMNVVLPIGISFYTFETITYVVDVYRGAHRPMSKFWDYQLYILLFPKLIAGPIIQYHDFAPQVAGHMHNESAENALRGFYRFCIGLGKKVLIANVVGSAADDIFALGNDLGTATAWIGAVSYSFQIYFDFSGYSDMAIGMGLMMGFRFPENFDNPYCATSVTDFWRKWHITLGAWMRNYLYIPLGGNRVNTRARLFFNLWLVFLLSGLWHGAAWGFIIWGAYHGVFLVLERMFLGRFLGKLGKWAVFYTFPVIVVGWVFFRAEQLAPAMRYLNALFVYRPDTMHWRPDTEFRVVTALACLFSFFTLMTTGRRVQERIFYERYTLRRHYLILFLCIVMLMVSAGRITTSTFNPFIYFRF